MKKITVRVVGGLGNQLHCYAFGRAVAAQNRAVLELDIESGFWSDHYGRSYLLGQFPGLNAATRATIPEWKRPIFKLLLRAASIISRLLPNSIKLVITENRPLRYQSEIHRGKYWSQPYFLGVWASHRYAEDIELSLRRELLPPAPADPAVQAVLSKIQSVRSCFIHWRSYKEEKGIHHPSLKEYYQTAVKHVLKLHPDVVFFVFSDDLEGARKEIIASAGKFVFVDLPASRGNLQSLNDFYLMFRCEHAIIGDSTFSWWAAWIGNQNSKTVVAPRGLSPWGNDWSPAHWYAIPVIREHQ